MAFDVSFEDGKKGLMENMNDSEILLSSPLSSSSFTNHPCEGPMSPPPVEDYNFSDLEDAEELEKGKDKAGIRILKIVGKYFPGKKIIDFINLWDFQYASVTFGLEVGVCPTSGHPTESLH
ncbi:hypothetical protein SUGI_0345940 [Cryptomeria japonica]|nr:hypothetical protein SUGI_0345940 [Cryptomeria japonica]